jgi:hypothetical protein
MLAASMAGWAPTAGGTANTGSQRVCQCFADQLLCMFGPTQTLSCSITAKVCVAA